MCILELGIGMCGMLVPLCIHGVSPLYAFIYQALSPFVLSDQPDKAFCFVPDLDCSLYAHGRNLAGDQQVHFRRHSGECRKNGPAGYMRQIRLARSSAVLISGYFLIGTIGLIGTTAFAAFLNFAIAGAVLIYGKRLKEPAECN